MPSCRILGRLCKRNGEKLPLPFNLTEFCERRWQARGFYGIGDTIRPSPEFQAGFEWRCTKAGQAGISEPFNPELNDLDDEEISDGGILWVSQVISNDSLTKTISSVAWSGPTGMTFSGENIVNTDGRQMCGAFANGTIAPGKYRVYARITFSDTHVEDFAVEVKVPT